MPGARRSRCGRLAGPRHAQTQRLPDTVVEATEVRLLAGVGQSFTRRSLAISALTTSSASTLASVAPTQYLVPTPNVRWRRLAERSTSI